MTKPERRLCPELQRPRLFKMKQILFPVLPAILATLFLAGCGGRQPLPQLNYRGSTPMGSASRIPTSVALEAGRSIGHSLTTYALMPGGYMMPINSGPSTTGPFNAEDQAAFLENLVRVLTERGLIQRAEAKESPAASITVRFLKTEHFPHMQDYVLDVFVTARMAERIYERVHHVSTIDSVNLVARMFQDGIDGRRRAAEMLLAAVIEDLEKWFVSTGAINSADSSKNTETLRVTHPFESFSKEIVEFLGARYVRPSTFWKEGISMLVIEPSRNVAFIELRWANSGGLPPFCLIDLYAEGDGTRIEIQEHDRILLTKVRVTEGIQEFVREVESAPPPAEGANGP